MLSTDMLSRIQFAFTISAHILFPAFSIGLATFLAIMEGKWLLTKKPIYLKICKFWMKIFALTFGMGVVSGIVMEFQLGTNWSGFTSAVGGVLGSLFTYEVLTAFFIEAGFLGVMIFGWNRVGKKLHYTATLLVCLGVTLSAFWILSANSWMQTPAGVAYQHGTFTVLSWWHVIFNPSVIPRYFHMLLAAYLTTAFVIAGVAAWYLLHNQHREFARECFKFSTGIIIGLIVVQIWLGDEAGLIDHQYQPIKTAAMEGAWNTEQGAPLILFAWPDMKTEKNYFQISIPHLASLINTHSWNGKLQGLKSVPVKDRPFVPLVFFSFRIMVGFGLLMLLIGLIALYLRFKGQLYEKRWFLRTCVYASPIGFLALWAGWITAECGRQPYIVYGYVRTANAVSPVSMHHVMFTFLLLVIVYGIIFGVFYFHYLEKIIKGGPDKATNISKEHVFSYLDSANKGGKL